MTVLNEKITSLYFTGINKKSDKNINTPLVSLELGPDIKLPVRLTPNFSIVLFRLKNDVKYKINTLLTDETNEVYSGSTTKIDPIMFDSDKNQLITHDNSASFNIRLAEVEIHKKLTTYQLHAELLTDDGALVDTTDTYFIIYKN